MIADIEPYVRETKDPEERWRRILNCVFAGYVTADVAGALASAIANEPEEEEFRMFDPSHIKVPDDLIWGVADDNSGLIRRSILDYDILVKYKPTNVDTIWQVKDSPDNSLGYTPTNHPDLLALYILEEYGFVRFGDFMVGRTVQPIWLQDKNTLVQDTVVVLPTIAEELFTRSFKCRSSIGGGFQYFGIFKMKEPTLHLHMDLGCRATAVLLGVGTPKNFDSAYPFDLTNIPPFKDYGTELYRN